MDFGRLSTVCFALLLVVPTPGHGAALTAPVEPRPGLAAPVAWSTTLARDPSSLRPVRVADERAQGTTRGSGASTGTADGVWSIVEGPSARSDHVAVIDTRRHQMIVIGDGSGRMDVWGLPLDGPPEWYPIAPSGLSPPALYYPGGVYDPDGDRVIVYAGGSSEVWALTLGASAAWSPLAVAGTPPPARHAQCVVHDSNRNRLIVFGGGVTGLGYPNDVWALTLGSTPVWEQVGASGTWDGVQDAAAIYDPIGDRLIVHGGARDTGPSRTNVTMELPLASPTWTQLSSGGPTISGHAACYDADGKRLVLFGGGNNNPFSGAFLPTNQAWTLSLDGPPVWASVPSSARSVPRPKVGASIVWDEGGDRGIVYGGTTSEGVRTRDAWALLPGAADGWQPLFAEQSLPTPDESHAAFDTRRGRVVMLTSRLNVLWTLQTSQSTHWTPTPIAGAGPVPRQRYAMIYDPPRDRLLVVGGYTGTNLADVWSLRLGDPPTWERLDPTGGSPPGRYGASAVYDPLRQEMILFGGTGQASILDDIWALKLSGSPENPGMPVWEIRAPSSAGPALRDHSAVIDVPRDRMVVFGGDGPDGASRDVWFMSLGSSPNWSGPLTGDPGSRSLHRAVFDPVGERMIVFGGHRGAYLNDCWALALNGAPQWSQLAGTSVGPEGTYAPGLVLDPDRNALLTAGGLTPSERQDTWLLPLVPQGTWHRVYSGETAPRPREFAAWVLDPVHDRVLVFGGLASSGVLDDVWALPLSGDARWRQFLPADASPGPLQSASAVYDPARDRVIVHGGAGGSVEATWQLRLSGTDAVWSPVSAAAPPPRVERHSAILDPVGDRMIVHGGYVRTPGYVSGSTWALSLGGTPAWSTIAPAGGSPPVRVAHGATYDPLRQRMLVFGGSTWPWSYLADTWALALDGAAAWTQLATSGNPPPPPTEDLSLALDATRDRAVVFPAGDDQPWALSLSGSPSWSALDPDGPSPGQRRRGAMLRDETRNRFLVAGGYSDDVVALGSPPAGLAKPMGLSAVSGACTDLIRLRWIDASTEDVFQIQAKYAGADDATYTVIGTTGADVETFLTTPAAAPGVPITFRVRAMRGGEASPFSNEATAAPGRVVPAGSVPVPKAIEVHSLGNGTSLRIRVHPPVDTQSSWAGIDELTLWVSEHASFAGAIIVPVNLVDDGPIETVIQGTQGTPYYVRAQTRICGTLSGWTVAPDPVAPSLPPILFCHGIWSDPGVWGPEWTDPLDAIGRPYRRIGFPSSARPWPEWGADLKRQLDDLLAGEWRHHLNVDIVAHSQGGLASRYMIEEQGERRVRTLVMLGTPNHGGRAATLGRYVGSLVRMCNAACDDILCPPALEPLCGAVRDVGSTRDAIHALEGNSEALLTLNFGGLTSRDDHCWDAPVERDRRGWTDYRLIAGLGPTAFSCARDLVFFNGSCFAWRARYGEEDPDACEGDGIVSWKSVRIRALGDPTTLAGHAHNRDLAVEGASVALYESAPVRQRVFDWIDGTPNPSIMSTTDSRLPIASTTDAEPDTVDLHSIRSATTGASANLHPAVVDSAGLLVVHASWPDSMGTLLLREPGGAIHSAADTAGLPWLRFEQHSGLGYSAFLVDNPEPGTWTAHVEGPPGVPSVPYELSWVIVNGGYRLTAGVEPVLVRGGEPAVVRATLSKGGGPVTATIVARVTRPGGTIVEVPLADDGGGADSLAGDGTYSGIYVSTCENGHHTITIEASPSPPWAPSLRTIESGVNVACHPELSVVSLASTPTVGQVGVEGQLVVGLSNAGETDAAAVTVTAIEATLGDTLGTTMAQAVAGGTVLVPVAWTPVLSGEYQIRVIARLVGQTEVAIADNERTIAVRVGGAAPVTGTEGERPLPPRFHLGLPRPNPFRHDVTVELDVPTRAHVSLEIFDVQGRRVRTIEKGVLPPGRHARVWDGRTESGSATRAGVYFVRMLAPGVHFRRKAILIR